MNEIREDPESSGIVIPENYPIWTDESKRALADVLFNKINVMAVCFVPVPIAVLASINKTTGLVVDFGASGVRICAVNERTLNKQENTVVLPYGGSNVATVVHQELKKRGIDVPLSVAEDIVIKHRQIVMNYEKEKDTLPEVLYENYGFTIKIDSQLRCIGPETFFSPSVTTGFKGSDSVRQSSKY